MEETLPLFERVHSKLLDGWLSARRTPTREVFEFALGRVYFALDGRYDPLACVREIRARLAEGDTEQRGQLPALDSELQGLEQRLVLLHHRGRGSSPRQLVLMGEPRVLDLDRPVILPFVPAESPSPAESPPTVPGFLVSPLPAVSAGAWAAEQREGLFREIAALVTHRIPQLGESWRGARTAEERLLRNADAIFGSDRGGLGDLERLVTESPAPDPSELCALTLLGGCLSGRDGIAMAERALRGFEEDPGFLEAFVTGLVLARHPVAPWIGRTLLEDSRPPRRAAGIGLLARLGEASADDLWRATQDVESVACAALVPFVLSGDYRVRQTLDELSLRVTEPGSFHDAFLTAAVLAAWPASMSWAERALRAGSELGARLFGIAAERRDAERLLEWTAIEPTVALIDALGWAGDPAAIGLLIGLLSLDDEPLVVSAAAALERISGAGLRQDIVISAESLLGEATSPPAPSGRDAPPQSSPETISLPSRDPAAWRAFFEAHRERFEDGVRTRRGAPYTPYVGWYELDRIPTAPIERQTLHYELVVRSGWTFDFDLDDFVSRQERRLAEISEAMRQKSGAPGAWSRPLEQRRLVSFVS
ncbi:MAG TPA: hypothetical protein VLC09_20655 [Polyangiaceae bacterium]|nr:hypothetical protein [Polyangiaceae bacterium]